MDQLHATTILLVRRNGQVCLISDGQVTNSASNTVLKSGASKVKRAAKGTVLVGFAGGGADALTLFSRFEDKLEQYATFERAVVELAMDWRQDRALRQLEAQMIVTNGERSFLVMGNGDLLEPDNSDTSGLASGDETISIGSGGNFAMAASRALLRHTELSAEQVARAAMTVAAELCIYTNAEFTVACLPPAASSTSATKESTS